MSADNRQECPKCRKHVDELITNIWNGVVTEEDRQIASETADNLEAQIETCFAMYYEPFFKGDKFHFRFYGKCDRCGFQYKINIEEDVPALEEK